MISGSVVEESPLTLAPPDHSVVTGARLRIPTTGAPARAHWLSLALVGCVVHATWRPPPAGGCAVSTALPQPLVRISTPGGPTHVARALAPVSLRSKPTWCNAKRRS